MKCVCIKKCYVKGPDGVNSRYSPGNVVDFGDTIPTHFCPLEKSPDSGDFSTVGEEELKESDFNLDDLKDYILNTYGIKAGNKGKVKTIALLIDSRERAVADHELKAVL